MTMLQRSPVLPLLALAVCAAVAPARAATLVVSAARMVDVLTGREVDRPQVVINGERIESVGKQGDPAPSGAQVLDLGNRTLLPGLIDMHVHLTSDPHYERLPRRCSSPIASG